MDCTQSETVHRLLSSQKVVLPVLRVGHIISPAQNLGVLKVVCLCSLLCCVASPLVSGYSGCCQDLCTLLYVIVDGERLIKILYLAATVLE